MKGDMMRKLSRYTLVTALLVLSGSAFAAPKGPTIVDVAIAVNSDTNSAYYQELDTLIAAVLAADPAVAETLTGNGQFTVFAPTDDAFGELGLDETNVGTVPVDVLTDILLYHVARGRRDAEDILSSSRIRTLQRGFLLQDGGVLTDAVGLPAAIEATDVPAANGIIHVIDAVVLPFEL
jgi:uncharacterized surface protein with fasciclin (FAS1) repeats